MEEKKKIELSEDELANVSGGKTDIANGGTPLSEEEKQGQEEHTPVISWFSLD